MDTMEHVFSYKSINKKFLPILKVKGIWFKKFKNVYAWIAKGGEKVISITDKFIETVNTAESGNFILENQTSDREKYIVKPDVFHTRYEVIKVFGDGKLDCMAKGEIIGIQLSKDLLQQSGLEVRFMFKAPWDEIQYASEGDFIVCNKDFEDIYRVSQRMFHETYEKKNKK